MKLARNHPLTRKRAMTRKQSRRGRRRKKQGDDDQLIYNANIFPVNSVIICACMHECLMCRRSLFMIVNQCELANLGRPRNCSSIPFVEWKFGMKKLPKENP